MGAVCGTPNAASADAEVNVADAARPALSPIPKSDAGDKTVVALGKFDAMHRGHRELARAASKMGAPHLVSFGGMAEVLGWAPKLNVVAESDRARVRKTWAEACGGKVPGEVVVPFADVRRMPPEAFVAFLKDTLHVSGIVAGSDYRFGFKAAGTAEALKTIGEAMGLDVTIVDLVPSGEDDAKSETRGETKAYTAQVSSTRVRACLAAGDVEQAARLLGRPHRLVLDASQAYAYGDGAEDDGETATDPTRAALNQYPAVGTYEGVLPVPEETPDAKPVRVTVRVTETEVAVTAPSAADLAAFAGGVDLTARAR
jgi:hypothetical protein